MRIANYFLNGFPITPRKLANRLHVYRRWYGGRRYLRDAI